MSAAPPELRIDAAVSAVLSWCYDRPEGRIAALYESAKAAQWNATVDIDWGLPVPFGAPLAPGRLDGALRAVGRAAGGPVSPDTFRWELHSWLVCQFLHGEQAAMVASARLAEVLPDVESKIYAVSQAGDEARHLEVFSRYVTEHLPRPYPISAPLRALFEDGLRAREWDLTALAIQCLVEPVALAGFRMAAGTLHDELITRIVTAVARDEARHVSYGVLLLEDVVPAMTAAERREREEFVLESMALLARRFLLGDVWERLGVDPAAGEELARTAPALAGYRRALFSRVVPMLGRIGLLGDAVVRGLEDLDLLDASAARTVRRLRAAGG